MIQFIKTESFIQRIWSVTLGISAESLRPKLISFDEQALLEEHTVLRGQYNEFLIELENNLKTLPSYNYEYFFNELEKLFFIPMPSLDIVNQKLESLLLQHGLDYQKFAWEKMKRGLDQNSHKEDVITDCISLLLIATGGASFYKKAFADVQRQRRILLGPTKKETPNSAALAALVQKYVPLVSQSVPKQQNGKLGLRQIALLHIYQQKVIPKAADEIAKAYGHKSGAKLYGHYLKLSSHTGRVADDIKGQKLASMIKAISGLLPILTGEALEKAQRELKTLEMRN